MEDNWWICCVLCTCLFTVNCVTYKDVIFVVDRSASIGDENLTIAMDFVYNVTQWLTVGPGAIDVAILSFGTAPSTDIDLGTYSNITDLLQAIENLGLSSNGGTDTAAALFSVRNMVQNNGRSGAKKAVVVMTDGLSDDTVKSIYVAELLQAVENVSIFTVGIGNAIFTNNEEIRAMASDPEAYHVHFVYSFIYICNLIPTIVPKLDPESSALDADGCPPIPPELQDSWFPWGNGSTTTTSTATSPATTTSSTSATTTPTTTTSTTTSPASTPTASTITTPTTSTTTTPTTTTSATTSPASTPTASTITTPTTTSTTIKPTTSTMTTLTTTTSSTATVSDTTPLTTTTPTTTAEPITTPASTTTPPTTATATSLTIKSSSNSVSTSKGQATTQPPADVGVCIGLGTVIVVSTMVFAGTCIINTVIFYFIIVRRCPTCRVSLCWICPWGKRGQGEIEPDQDQDSLSTDLPHVRDRSNMIYLDHTQSKGSISLELRDK